ncbi:hypothetical protein [Streptomyces sp. NPDC058084]|uniref:hypothetical protein n=1 Tax=Streptomyces sp. NPDC058084 TaxID=3346333 RepID=UPI0036E37F1A
MTHSGQGPEQQYPAAQPLPPEVTPGGPSDAHATQYLPPVPAQPPVAPPQPGYGYPQAPQAPQPGYGYPQQAAQPPQPGYGYPGPDAQATQYIAPVPPQAPQPAPDAQATQYIAPVAPQAPQDAQATQYLPPVAGGPAPVGGPDAQATQYIAPVPPQAPAPQAPAPRAPHLQQERPPLADFDNLFRSETPQPAPVPPVAPQQQYQPPQPPPQQDGYQDAYQQDAYQDAYYDDQPEPQRRRSPAVLIAAVVAGCAVIGLGAGALLSGGDDDKKNDTAQGGQNVAASSAAPSGEATQKAADPAEGQAKALDKLLADSNNSRGAVIRSVEAIKSCDNLDQAASDLRGAAEQRRGLVKRLEGLSVDQLPNSSALTGALTRAWQASASADDHYAAWAEQAKSKKVCKGGHARSTSQTVEATKKSGEATTAKREAAGLWNPTAEKYGLTKREPTQL